MRQVLFTVGLLFLGSAYAQKDDYQKILRTDPYLSNGYFIVDQAKYQAMDLDHIDIDVIVATPGPNGEIKKEKKQSFSIKDNFFGKADMSLLQNLPENSTAYYHLRAIDHNGGTPLDYEGIGAPGPTMPLVCSETCEAPDYAWTINAYAGDGQAQLEIDDATTNGSYYYFYVADGDDWLHFKQTYSTSYFNINPGAYMADNWDAIANSGGTEVIRVAHTSPDMRDIEGYNMGGYGWFYSGPAHGIAKKNWRWPNINTTTMIDNTDEWCTSGDGVLKDVFNADDNMQIAMGNHPEMGPVTCAAMIFGGDTPGTWQNGNQCTQYTIGTSTDPETGEVDLVSWSIELVACSHPEIDNHPSTYWNLFSMSVIRLGPDDANTVVDVVYPAEKDPKLVPMPKTQLQSGLYEFRVVLKNGQVIRHYEDFDAPVVINSHFSSYADINIYPVPVKGKDFAVDFNLLAPMQIQMTVVNNEGKPVYDKVLDFPIAGLNKHVVHMDEEWPKGIYHGIFQFQDGSITSLNFNVEN